MSFAEFCPLFDAQESASDMPIAMPAGCSYALRNLVLCGQLSLPLDLARLAGNDVPRSFGHWRLEYDPDIYPGMLARFDNVCIILFARGKFIVSGSANAAEMCDLLDVFINCSFDADECMPEVLSIRVINSVCVITLPSRVDKARVKQFNPPPTVDGEPVTPTTRTRCVKLSERRVVNAALPGFFAELNAEIAAASPTAHAARVARHAAREARTRELYNTGLVFARGTCVVAGPTAPAELEKFVRKLVCYLHAFFTGVPPSTREQFSLQHRRQQRRDNQHRLRRRSGDVCADPVQELSSAFGELILSDYYDDDEEAENGEWDYAAGRTTRAATRT